MTRHLHTLLCRFMFFLTEQRVDTKTIFWLPCLPQTKKNYPTKKTTSYTILIFAVIMANFPDTKRRKNTGNMCVFTIIVIAYFHTCILFTFLKHVKSFSLFEVRDSHMYAHIIIITCILLHSVHLFRYFWKKIVISSHSQSKASIMMRYDDHDHSSRRPQLSVLSTVATPAK